MILERPAYPILPHSGARDERETARVVNRISAGHSNNVLDLDLSAETSPYLLEHPEVSEFSWVRPMQDGVTVTAVGKQQITLTWSGTGPSLCRLAIIG